MVPLSELTRVCGAGQSHLAHWHRSWRESPPTLPRCKASQAPTREQAPLLGYYNRRADYTPAAEVLHRRPHQTAHVGVGRDGAGAQHCLWAAGCARPTAAYVGGFTGGGKPAARRQLSIAPRIVVPSPLAMTRPTRLRAKILHPCSSQCISLPTDRKGAFGCCTSVRCVSASRKSIRAPSAFAISEHNAICAERTSRRCLRHSGHSPSATAVSCSAKS